MDSWRCWLITVQWVRKPVEDELLHDGFFCGVCEMVNLLSSDEIKKLVFHMFLPSGTFSF